MIEAITAMSAILDELQSLAGAASAPSAADLVSDPAKADVGAAPSFSQALQGALGRVNDTIAHANASAQAFSAGDQNLPLSDVMVVGTSSLARISDGFAFLFFELFAESDGTAIGFLWRF